MNAMKGLFDDGTGKFTKTGEQGMEMARTLMHSPDYHKYKAQIMKPVNAFLDVLDERTAGAVKQASKSSRNAYLMTIALLIASQLVSITAPFLVYRHINSGVGKAVHAAEQLAGGDLNAAIQVDRNDEIG